MASIPWITWDVKPASHQAIPAIYIADCLDWEKNLWTWTTMKYTHNDNSSENITYTEYNTDINSATWLYTNSDSIYIKRQKYLLGWSQSSGSHLPSAYSYVNSSTDFWCTGTSCFWWSQAWEYIAAFNVNWSFFNSNQWTHLSALWDNWWNAIV